MIKITFPDASVKEFECGVTPYQVAQSISSSLAKKCIVARVNGALFEMNREIKEDASISLLTDISEELDLLNHSCAHLLAQAIKELYPHAMFGVGPSIEEGFYYDMDLGEDKITEDDLGKIEKKMQAIVGSGANVVRKEVSKSEALELFKDDIYKTELINELPESEIITVYEQGPYRDLCRGPHVASVKFIKHFKLLSVSGAYWRGDAKRNTLQRIYGTCFGSAEALKEHLQILEERKQRDHRKLGKEMGIFMFDDLVGKGLPMWLPNGFLVRRALADYIMDKEYALGYLHVMTPSLGNVNLYKTSGHWAHYKDDMFPAMELDDEAYVLRPMNCPHHMVIYKSRLHSYRDLPIRMAEIANDFRFEASGALTGIERTRAFSQNDSHIFCLPSQIASEFKGVVKLILDVYNDFGFKNYKFRLSLRDKNDTEKYFGNDDLWEKSEAELREVLTSLGVDYYEAEGEAAFYGPKLDVQVRSAIGHDVTLSTIQLDYQLPERFELTYVNEQGEKVRPVVIHRAILGSLDRFIAFLIEETKGLFPLWLCPNQVEIIPVNNEFHLEYAKLVEQALKSAGVRCEIDDREEKLGYKMREAQLRKIPYQLVLGDVEVNSGSVNVRKHGEKATVSVSLEEFVSNVVKQINEKK